jgi:transposase
MKLRNAIGIDPDAKGFQCALVTVGEPQPQQKGYLATEGGIESFIRWVKRQDEVIVAIEGKNGLSLPIEKALRASETVFYSFKPSDIDKFRKAVLGQNKNNKRDAESTARYAMALESQGILDKWKRVWRADEQLQGLTRSYAQKIKESTREINRLWKLVRAASVDLYLALGGRHPDIEIPENILQNESVLALLVEKPDINEWKTFSETDFAEVMGVRNYPGREQIIKAIQKVSQSFTTVPAAICLMIKNAVSQIMLLRQQQSEIKKMIGLLTKDNEAVQKLTHYKGIGVLTSSTLNAEIIDIRRFANDDNLASYSGLARREFKTGDNEKEIVNHFFNPRLKHAFMTAAKNFLLFNPDSHLTGYYNNLIKGGMKRIDAQKRVARALVRVFYKALYSLVESNNADTINEEEKGEGSDMANGSCRCDRYHSNISLQSPISNNTEWVEKSKKDRADTNFDNEGWRKGEKNKKSENSS